MRCSDLVPGRELDALIAERVLGYHREMAPPDAKGECGGGEVLVPAGNTLAELEAALPRLGAIALTFFVPKYSTDIVQAWSLVRQLQRLERADGWRWNLQLMVYSYNRTYAYVGLDPEGDDWSEGNGEHATELAICKAALAAVDALAATPKEVSGA